MSYEKKNNLAGETETLSPDDQNVSRLLSNLKRVDAPEDFDFHLKARIANASPAQYRPVRFFPVLKYALPLALFLVVGAAFVLTNFYSRGWNVPAVGDVHETPAPSSVNSATLIPPPETIAKIAPSNGDLGVDNYRPSDGQLLADDSAKAKKIPRLERRSVPSGGSKDDGVKGEDETIRSRDIKNSNSQSNVGPTSPPLQFRQILMSLGIDASDAGEKTWKVMELTKDGIASRSGLQVGDLMEAIDDKPIKPLYDGSFSASSISVRRGSEVVKINIRPNRP